MGQPGDLDSLPGRKKNDLITNNSEEMNSVGFRDKSLLPTKKKSTGMNESKGTIISMAESVRGRVLIISYYTYVGRVLRLDLVLVRNTKQK